jgi:TatD DNase family protein
MNLIDSHCHLDFEVFDHDRDVVLNNCQTLGVNNIIVPGVTADTWNKLLSVCQSSNNLHPALGLHPMFMAEHQAKHIALLNDYVAKFNPIAIGEIGLDFYVPEHNKQSQIELFEKQLIIANDANLPVILHVRKAYDQVLSLLIKHKINRGIVHAFSGSEQQAQLYIKQGFLLGIGGALTHDRATKLRSLFGNLPLTSIVLETDAPDMPLSGQQGQRNTPENICTIVATLAELRTESIEQIADISSQNVRKALSIS